MAHGDVPYYVERSYDAEYKIMLRKPEGINDYQMLTTHNVELAFDLCDYMNKRACPDDPLIRTPETPWIKKAD